MLYFGVLHILLNIPEQNGPHTACTPETTEWSACSVTCGMGVSFSLTINNENNECQTVQQRRLCIVRPCGVHEADMVSKIRKELP